MWKLHDILNLILSTEQLFTESIKLFNLIISQNLQINVISRMITNLKEFIPLIQRNPNFVLTNFANKKLKKFLKLLNFLKMFRHSKNNL